MAFGRKKTFTEKAAEVAESTLESLADSISTTLAHAKESAGPALAEAKVRAGEAAEKAAEIAREKAAEGAAYAAEHAAEGKEAAVAKVAEIRGEDPAPKKSKWKKVLLVGGLAALAGVVAKMLSGRKESDNWQSAYVPAKPASPTPAAKPAAAKPAAPAGDPLTDPLPGASETSDDRAGAGPDEALSDATDTPHAATTPDAPAAVVDVDDEGPARS